MSSPEQPATPPRELEYLRYHNTNYRTRPEQDPPTVFNLVRRAQYYVSPYAPTDVPYDDNPERYVEFVRRQVHNSKFSSFSYGSAERYYRSANTWVKYDENQPLPELEAAWSNKHAAEIEDVKAEAKVTDVAFNTKYWPYFSLFLRTVAQAPRIMADMRADTFRDNMMGDVPTRQIALDAAIEKGIYDEPGIKTALECLDAFDYRMSMPDFWRFSAQQQEAVAATIGKQCLAFWNLAGRYGQAQTFVGYNTHLFRYPVSQLQEVIDSSDDSIYGPDIAFLSFVSDPVRFARILERTRNEVGNKTQGEDFRQCVRSLEVGDELDLTHNEGYIGRDQARQVLTEIQAVIGHQLSRTHERPQDVSFVHWNEEESNVATQLMGHYYGLVKELNIRRLSVDERFAHRLVRNWSPDKVPLEAIRRYAASAGLKVGGRAIPAQVEFAVFMRNDRGGAPQVNKTVLGARGPEDQKLFLDETANRAHRRLAWHMMHPTRTAHVPKR
jgi:hypothetical protein